MAASQQHKVENHPSAFSHHQAVVYPWECWNEYMNNLIYKYLNKSPDPSAGTSRVFLLSIVSRPMIRKKNKSEIKLH